MTVSKREFVTFYSPGSLFAESTTKPIASRDVKLAVQMSESVVERYNATPYGFRFESCLVADPIPDGNGGFLEVKSKLVGKSGIYFLGGKLETLDQIEARNDPKERILLSNMRINEWPVVWVSTKGYRSTQTFDEIDFVVDATGEIIERGDDQKWVAYRERKKATRE